MRTLAPDRQVAAMPEPAIRADFDQPLDVHGGIFAQIAFHVAFVLDDLADAVHLFFVQVLDLLHGLNFRGGKNPPRARIADAVNVSQRDLDVLVTRKIDACNTSHSLVSYPCLCLCFEFSQITRTTPLRCTILHLSQIFLTDARTFMFPALFASFVAQALLPVRLYLYL